MDASLRWHDARKYGQLRTKRPAAYRLPAFLPFAAMGGRP